MMRKSITYYSLYPIQILDRILCLSLFIISCCIYAQQSDDTQQHLENTPSLISINGDAKIIIAEGTVIYDPSHTLKAKSIALHKKQQQKKLKSAPPKKLTKAKRVLKENIETKKKIYFVKNEQHTSLFSNNNNSQYASTPSNNYHYKVWLNISNYTSLIDLKKLQLKPITRLQESISTLAIAAYRVRPPPVL